MNSIVLIFFLLNLQCASGKKNVLFIVADDLRPDIGVYRKNYQTQIYTPNLDSLASKSLLLKKAYVQQAFCSPSRTSFLTGRRPDTTHVYDLKRYFRDVGGNFTTIPQYFKENGYRTIGMGKIFHPGIRASSNDDPISWTEPYFHVEDIEQYETKNVSWRSVPKSEYQNLSLPDSKLADHAIEVLRYIGPASRLDDKPFFVAIGFNKPHLPFVFPEEFLTFYQNDSIHIPNNGFIPQGMPYIAWHKYWELMNYRDIKSLNVTGNPNTTIPIHVIQDLTRAYYTSVSYIDFEIGRILQELDDLGLSNNTIVSFIGDHGYQLGEHGEWCKHTNFEESIHAPMMIRIPGRTDNGVVSNRLKSFLYIAVSQENLLRLTDKGIVTEKLTEFVDLFPTLVEAAGLQQMDICPEDSSKIALCREGTSLMPLIRNPSLSWKPAVFSQYPRYQNKTHIMGYTIRTDRFRYTEWPEFTGPPNYKPVWTNLFGTELYDHVTDPEENYSRANDPSYAQIRTELSARLHSGWRNSQPSIS
ncbi:hypothetical protein LOTGIDRAFT_104488 [Lottia gigantea]|uniref:Sulfatase N-terminal domain-containing protein n=1 Tax=Lottia gigantea TaxID=225164 RepID=V4AFW7_LOTGI|nr:hypothetical protein LOTGIDRAFT_104488 [Lottia gigantea]ESO94040.1 hypothetical protein LOTGIDRAFT_104488 [Lottia gigantea]